MIQWQRTLRKKLTRLTRSLKADPWGSTLRNYLWLAFLYGMVHALGPGHGKAVTGSYFLNRQGTLRQGLMMGFLFAFTHILSATLLLLIGHSLMKLSGLGSLDKAGYWLHKISAVLLMSLGIILTVRTLAAFRLRPACVPSQPENVDVKSFCSVAAAAGLVPCPGAYLILLFALSQQLLLPGLLAMLAMLAMASGMGLTLSLTAVAKLICLLRDALLGNLAETYTVLRPIGKILAVFGGLAITALGALLLAPLS